MNNSEISAVYETIAEKNSSLRVAGEKQTSKAGLALEPPKKTCRAGLT